MLGYHESHLPVDKTMSTTTCSTQDANRQGRKSASYENQANQALQNAASSLESTLPGQMKIPQPATDKSRWSRKKLQPVVTPYSARFPTRALSATMDS